MYIDHIWPFTTFISRNKHNKNIRLRLYWLRLRCKLLIRKHSEKPVYPERDLYFGCSRCLDFGIHTSKLWWIIRSGFEASRGMLPRLTQNLGYIYTKALKLKSVQWRIQDFPEGGREHAKFSRKLHEIERIWTPRGGRASLTPPPRSANAVHRLVY